MLFWLIIGFTIFAALAIFLQEGVWSNTITLMQIIFSGLAAFAFFQPLTVLVDEQTGGSYTYALDIVMIWAIYSVTMIVLKLLCQALSKTRMKFIPPQIDSTVGPLIGLVAGVVLAGFVGATLHVSPLPRDGLGGAMDYKKGEIDAAPIYAVDILWLNMVEAASATGISGNKKFTADGFVRIYGERRQTYSEQDSFAVRRNGS